MNAQIKGIRKLWESVTSKEETMTAYEMALIPHKLNKSGDIANTAKNGTFVWNQKDEIWMRY